MTLTQYIFTILVFLRPRPRNDELLAALPRRHFISAWIQRPFVPLISLTVVAALTFQLVKMSYFLPPKVSDAAPPPPQRATSTPQASRASPPLKPNNNNKAQPIRRVQTDRRRPTSFGGWMRNMFPSQRPERGGTSRRQGYWEQMETEGSVRPRRRVTDSQYSIGDVSVDSNHIARWNVARDLSEDQPPHQQRVVPAASKSPLLSNDEPVDTSWSWSPNKGSEDDQISVTQLGGVLRSDDEDDDANNGPQIGSKVVDMSSLGIINTEATAGGKQIHKRNMLRARVKARRRQRRSLKESGDYLGVQGINPLTGQLDIVSPTDSSPMSTTSHQETVNSIMSTWRDKWRNNRRHKAGGSLDKDEDGESCRLQKGKKNVREMGKAVRWKRRAGEWSSIQSPALSPITQSVKSASPSSRESLFSSSQVVTNFY